MYDSYSRSVAERLSPTGVSSPVRRPAWVPAEAMESDSVGIPAGLRGSVPDHDVLRVSTVEFDPSKGDSGPGSRVVPDLVIYRVKEQGDTRPAMDYQKKIADKAVTGGWTPALLVYGTELGERLAGFGIAQNLFTYLTNNMHLHMTPSANIVTTYVGLSYMTFILGGYVADTWCGRFLTLCGAIVVEFIGLVLLVLSAALPVLRPPKCEILSNGDLGFDCEPATGWTLAVLFIGLSLVALGIGTIKVCVSAFGADQFDIADPNEKNQLPFFFNWFFFFVSVGGLLAVTILVYIQDSAGRGWGFGVLAVTMLLSLCLFVSGRKKYRYRRPTGSPVTHALQVAVAAIRNRHLPQPCHLRGRHDHTKCATSSNWLFRLLDKAPIIPKEAVSTLGSSPPIWSSWKVASVEKVEEVKRIFHLIPTMSSSFLYYTVLAQTLTFSVEQSATLDRNIGPHFTLPSASVGIFLHLSVLITIPFFDFCCKPLLRKLTGRDEGISILQRIGFGLFLSIFAMITAALVERRRLSVAHRVGANLYDADHMGIVIPMRVWWLVPQYVLVGAGEVFAYIGHMEFFYNEAPKTMRTIGTGFFLFTLAMGYFTSGIIVLIVQHFFHWLEINLNRSRLDLFYWTMAALAGANFFVYLLITRHYTYTYELYQRDQQRSIWRFSSLRASSRVMPTSGTPVEEDQQRSIWRLSSLRGSSRVIPTTGAPVEEDQQRSVWRFSSLRGSSRVVPTMVAPVEEA